MMRRTKRVKVVDYFYKPDRGLAVWPVAAGSYEEARDSNWPSGFGYIESGGSGSTACFSADPWAEDVWRSFKNDPGDKGCPEARRWLIGLVREALKRRS